MILERCEGGDWQQAMGRRLLGQLPGLERSDRWLLQHLPCLQRWCRYVVLTLHR